MVTQGVQFTLQASPSPVRSLQVSPTTTALVGTVTAAPSNGTIVPVGVADGSGTDDHPHHVYTSRSLEQAVADGVGAGTLYDALEAYYSIANGPVVWARMATPADAGDESASALPAWKAIANATPGEKAHHHVDIYATNGYATERDSTSPYDPTTAASDVTVYLEGLAGTVAHHDINALVIPDSPWDETQRTNAITWGNANTGDTVWISWNDGRVGGKVIPGSVIRAAVMASLDAAVGGPLNSSLAKPAPHVSAVSPAWTADDVLLLWQAAEGSVLWQEEGDYVIEGDKLDVTHNYEALQYVGDLRRFMYVQRALARIFRPYRGERPTGAMLETIEEDLNNHYDQYVRLGYFAGGSLRIPPELNTASPLRQVTVEWAINPIGDIESFVVNTTLV